MMFFTMGTDTHSDQAVPHYQPTRRIVLLAINSLPGLPTFSIAVPCIFAPDGPLAVLGHRNATERKRNGRPIWRSAWSTNTNRSKSGMSRKTRRL